MNRQGKSGEAGSGEHPSEGEPEELMVNPQFVRFGPNGEPIPFKVHNFTFRKVIVDDLERCKQNIDVAIGQIHNLESGVGSDPERQQVLNRMRFLIMASLAARSALALEIRREDVPVVGTSIETRLGEVADDGLIRIGSWPASSWSVAAVTAALDLVRSSWSAFKSLPAPAGTDPYRDFMKLQPEDAYQLPPDLVNEQVRKFVERRQPGDRSCEFWIGVRGKVEREFSKLRTRAAEDARDHASSLYLRDIKINTASRASTEKPQTPHPQEDGVIVKFESERSAVVREGRTAVTVHGSSQVWVLKQLVDSAGRRWTWEELLKQRLNYYGAELNASGRRVNRRSAGRSSRGEERSLGFPTSTETLKSTVSRLSKALKKLQYHVERNGSGVMWNPDLQ